MRCGFGRQVITPTPGVRMMGFALRDAEKGCEAVGDPIHTRAAYFEHDGARALLVSFDMCFIGKLDAYRLKGMLGSRWGFTPAEILLNASHSHVGPASGQWYVGDFLPANHDWLLELGQAVTRAVEQAITTARPVTLRAGSTTTTLPMHRRRVVDGRAINRPHPAGPVCDVLPVVQAVDAQGQAVCVLFSAAAHPSSQSGWTISAEYPGVAMDCIDARFGQPVAMFLQGTAGDAKLRVCGEGRDNWRQDHRPDLEAAGHTLAQEVLSLLDRGLDEHEPAITTALTDSLWQLQTPPDAHWFQDLLAHPRQEHPVCQKFRSLWAQKQLDRLHRGQALPTAWPILTQAIRLGRAVRLLALEGEPVAQHGHRILAAWPAGVTFPLGYSNGEGAYLPTSAMLPEGGMEVDSYWEYCLPAPFAPGMEQTLEQTLTSLRERDGV